MDEKYDKEENDKHSNTSYHHDPPHSNNKVKESSESWRVEDKVSKSEKSAIFICKHARVQEIAVASKISTWSSHLDVSAHLSREFVSKSHDVFISDLNRGGAHSIQDTANMTSLSDVRTLALGEVESNTHRAIT